MLNSRQSKFKMTVGSDQWNRLLKQGAARYQLELDDQCLQHFTRFAKELLRWNRKINLTSIIEPSEIVEKHFIDALAVHPYLSQGATILDMGAGPGFPGIPLKLIRPMLQMTLIDASVKKVSFLKHVIRILKLANIQAHHMRAEDFPLKRSEDELFNVVICRAFSTLDKFLDLALPLLAQGGTALAMKGKFPYGEMKVIGGNGTDPQTICYRHYQLKVTSLLYQLPFSCSHRSLICFTSLNHRQL
jgi:16S rRNA (guanine527-N7)-methyltransferase